MSQPPYSPDNLRNPSNSPPSSPNPHSISSEPPLPGIIHESVTPISDPPSDPGPADPHLPLVAPLSDTEASVVNQEREDPDIVYFWEYEREQFAKYQTDKHYLACKALVRSERWKLYQIALKHQKILLVIWFLEKLGISKSIVIFR